MSKRLTVARPRKVDPADLVTFGDIAERLDKRRETVRMWAYRSGSTGFPEPIAKTAAGTIYLWSEVEAWHRARPLPG